ncbi:hypothetical protein Tco_1282993 [Tanacetum coccineum]
MAAIIPTPSPSPRHCHPRHHLHHIRHHHRRHFHDPPITATTTPQPSSPRQHHHHRGHLNHVTTTSSPQSTHHLNPHQPPTPSPHAFITTAAPNRGVWICGPFGFILAPKGALGSGIARIGCILVGTKAHKVGVQKWNKGAFGVAEKVIRERLADVDSHGVCLVVDNSHKGCLV